MARIPEQFIDDLISRSDIVALIDHRVPLQNAGSEFRACCPFHNEKTPSFYVSPTKQFYHCFGCGAHGTVVSFLMNYENLPFLDAIDALAAQAGMVVPQDAHQDSEQAAQQRKTKLSLQSVVEQASKWYQSQLGQHPNAGLAQSYLEKRGLDNKTIAEFGIGYAPDGWDNLIKTLGNSSEKIKQLSDAGLLIEKDQGGHYDRFRGRIMFPIEDHRGQLVGFGGRVMADEEPKYLNSPETPLFHKGSELYGYFRARREMGKLDEALVVEGYMDVVGLAQNGVNHAVATLGTATTPIHLQRLFRAASKVVFCFDGDRAGKKAAWRALQIALPFMEDGRQIRFLLMPDGEDPDSLIRKEGSTAFQKRRENALALDVFLFSSLSEPLDLSQMDQRAKLSKLATPLLEKLPKGSFKSMMYVKLSELVGVNQIEKQSAASHSNGRFQNTTTQTAPPQDYEQSYFQGHSQGQTENSAQNSAQNSTQNSEDASVALPELKGACKGAITVLLQFPELIHTANEFEICADESDPCMALLDQLIGMINVRENINTAQIIERLRDHPQHEKLNQLAVQDLMLTETQTPAKTQIELRKLLARVVQKSVQSQVDGLLKLSSQRALSAAERQSLSALLKQKSIA